MCLVIMFMQTAQHRSLTFALLRCMRSLYYTFWKTGHTLRQGKTFLEGGNPANVLRRRSHVGVQSFHGAHDALFL